MEPIIDPRNIIDLTKLSVDFERELDTMDAVLLVTTGGVGYLARAAYKHVDGKKARGIELQRKNLVVLLDEAKQRGANRVIVRVHPEVPVYGPDGGEIRYLQQTPRFNEIEFIL